MCSREVNGVAEKSTIVALFGMVGLEPVRWGKDAVDRCGSLVRDRAWHDHVNVPDSRVVNGRGRGRRIRRVGGTVV